MRKFFAAALLVLCFMNLCALSSSAVVRAEKNTYYIDDAEGSALIKNGNKKQARQEAQQAAYRDAINKAIDMLTGSTDESLRSRVFAKSQSMVKNFKIIDETVEGDTLHIVGSCTVSEKNFDGVLGPEIIDILGNPRIMIIVDKESSSNAALVEDTLLQLFEKAGYLIVDSEQAQNLLALDPKKGISDPEMLAKAAKTFRADIIIQGHAASGAQSAQRFGIKMYRPSASVKVKAVLTKTGYQISSSTISRGTNKWGPSSSAGGMISSGLRQAAEEIIYKIAFKLSEGSGVNIQLANASFRDKQQLIEYLRKTGKVYERNYSNKLAELDLVSPKNAEEVALLIDGYTLSGGMIAVEGQNAQVITAKVTDIAPPPPPSPDITYIVINIYIEKLYDNEAEKVKKELREFIGSSGEVEDNFKDSTLRVNVKFPENAQGKKDVHDIEAFLRDEMTRRGVRLVVDKSEGNSIRGTGDHILFFGN